MLFASLAHSQELPQTLRLEWPEEDLSDRLMTGAHRFVERKIAEAPAKRATLWARDYSSTEAYAKSIEPNRARLKTILGVVERIACWVRVATELEFDEGDATRRVDPLAVWELRRRLYELGGPPVK